MDLGFSILYPYIIAILVSAALVLLSRKRSHRGEIRIVPDVTLQTLLEIPATPRDFETQPEKREQQMQKSVFIDTDFTLPPHAVLANDVIVKGRLTLGEGCKLQGSAKAQGAIALDPYATVLGNLVSDSDISLGCGSQVLGIVHARNNVSLMQSSSVGVSVVSGGTIFMSEGASIGKQVHAGRGLICLREPHRESFDHNTPVSREFLEQTCRSCGSLLLAYDALRQLWRCLNCGRYQYEQTHSRNTLRLP